MASLTLYSGRGTIVFLDKGHLHDKMDPHVHEIDLSKISIADLEKLEQESRNGSIALHTWKKVPGAVTTRRPTSRELEQIEKYVK